MNTNSTARVLLLAKQFRTAEAMFGERHAGASLEIVEVCTPQQFFHEMRDTPPDVLVTEADGIDGLSIGEILEEAGSDGREIPLIVLGDEDICKEIRHMYEGVTEYLPLSASSALSSLIHHLLRNRELLVRQRELEIEARSAQNALLSNQKLIEMGRLAGSIAHEINNPLESITNLLYLLQSEASLSEDARNYVELAEREMGRVANICKQALSFYRESRTPVRIRPIDLVEELLALYSRKMRDAKLDVVRQYKTEESVVVFPGEMRQVLSNLVTNAIEASPAGSKIVVRISAGRQWSDEGIHGVRIVVADQGHGISAEARRNLGQLFYTTKGQRGTGMGLWVSNAIVKRYGGNIQIYSSTREGRQGSAFSIFIPTNLRPQRVPTDVETSENGDGVRLRRINDHDQKQRTANQSLEKVPSRRAPSRKSISLATG